MLRLEPDMLIVALSVAAILLCAVGILLYLLSRQKHEQQALRQRLDDAVKVTSEVQAKLSQAVDKLARFIQIESVEIEMKRLTAEANAKAKAIESEAESKAKVVEYEAESRAKSLLTVSETKVKVAEVAAASAQEAARIKLEKVVAEFTKTKDQLAEIEGTKLSLSDQVTILRKEVAELSIDAEIQEYGLYEPKYQFPDSPKYKQELDQVCDEQKAMVKKETAAKCGKAWVVEGSAARGREMVKHELKLMLLAFNGECDALISKVRYDNQERIKERIEKQFERINKIGIDKHCYITRSYLELKVKELYLTHEYAEKKQLELEEQRAIREQMREEEKAQRELEREQVEAEREAERYKVALEKAQRDADKSQGAKLDKLNGEIARLNSALAEATVRKERAVSQAQLTRSGWVYIISNIGSFGEEVYKLGMTRRLDPYERIYELGDASVPFPFDVHATIKSDDAPKLEALLHRYFDSHRINLVNTRKEFFRVKLDEIREVVEKNHAGEIKFTLLAEAVEYRRSEAIRKPK